MSLCLHIACSEGRKNNLKKIIEVTSTSMLETKNKNGKTPLILCVLYNHIECAKILLKAGVYVDNCDNRGQTALHLAVNKGIYNCVKLLLSFGASCIQKDYYGITPLHFAAIQKCPKCLSMILKKVISGGIDMQDSLMKTGLHWSSAYLNVEHIKVLLFQGANACIPDESGKTPLHWAAMRCHPLALNCVKTLLKYETSLLNWQDYEGRSALHLAVATGKKDVVQFLIGHRDCNVDMLDNSFCTPLHWACRRGLWEKADLLMNKRISNCKIVDDHGATPLHHAVFYNHIDVIKIILSRNYVHDTGDFEGRNSFMWAAGRKRDEIVKYMITQGTDINYVDENGMSALHVASSLGHLSTIELLLNANIPVDMADNYGMSALLRACEYGQSQAVHILVKNGADLKHRDINGCTCLHWSAITGHAHLCQTLLQIGGPVNAQDSYGMTALHYACTETGFLNTISVLLEFGADVNITDIKGTTPLQWAVSNNLEDAVSLLCLYNADVNSLIFTDNWITALDIVYTTGNSEIISIIEKYGALTSQNVREVAATAIQSCYRKKQKLYFRLKKRVSDIALLYKNNRLAALNSLKTCGNEDMISFLIEEDYFTCFNKKSINPFKVFNIMMQDCSSEIQMGLKEITIRFIQKNMKKHLLKKKFAVLRKNMYSLFTEKERTVSEKKWNTKLGMFYNY